MGVLDKLRLDGKVAVVTGAGRGLGRAMALALADAGADVVCAARSRDQIEETASLIREKGRRALAVPTDVSRSDQCTALIETTLAELGRLDILVNNAGGATPGYNKPVEEITDEEWRLGIDTNLSSVFYCCRAAIPHLIKQGGGKIINVSSGYGLRGGRNNFIYASAKAAIINFTRSLALTYARFNIQANCIIPGFFPHENQMVIQYLRGGSVHPHGPRGPRRGTGASLRLPGLAPVGLHERPGHRPRRRRPGGRAGPHRPGTAGAPAGGVGCSS